MASQRRPTLKNLLGMYLCHTFELRNEIWFEYYSLYGACFDLTGPLNSFLKSGHSLVVALYNEVSPSLVVLLRLSILVHSTIPFVYTLYYTYSFDAVSVQTDPFSR